MAKKKKNKNNTSSQNEPKTAKISPKEVAGVEAKTIEKKLSSKEGQATEKLTPSTEKKAKKTSQTESSSLGGVKSLIENGNYQKAREELTELVAKTSDENEKKTANRLLAGLDLDTRTLLVGLLGVVMLLMIPTVGYVKALWVLPVFFVLLLLDPGLFKSQEP